jgi:hypothetical protein
MNIGQDNARRQKGKMGNWQDEWRWCNRKASKTKVWVDERLPGGKGDQGNFRRRDQQIRCKTRSFSRSFFVTHYWVWTVSAFGLTA